MSITLDTITHAVNSFNDIPDITFDSVDIGEFANEVEIYTNTPAVLIPTKLNAMASSMKTWLNTSIAAPLEAQQNTFKNEVVVRTNEAMTAVETYINNEVKAFVNDIFIPWANNSGVIMSDNANLLETNISTTLGTLMSDYSIHVQGQDAIIAQALIDFETSLAQFTTGATDSGYSVHQTNELVADLVMTNPINPGDYTFDNTGVNVTATTEGLFTTHHIDYDSEGDITSFGESLQIPGEVRPFVNHNVLTTDTVNDSISIEQVKAYSFSTNVSTSGLKTFRAIGHEADGSAAVDLTILNNTSIPDTDNPEITLTRGIKYALLFDGIDKGDFVTIEDISGNLYSDGVSKQFAVDGDSILFRPFSSYCTDGVGGVTGWGVPESAKAVELDGAVTASFPSPIECESYFESVTSILDDFTRSYEYDIPGESYNAELFNGMIYDVFISDDGGFVDTFAYTIDHNGKLGTGAIVNANYDDGCSDITITDGGKGYSENTQLRIVDNIVHPAGATLATGTIVVGDGTITEVVVDVPGDGYIGYWEVTLPDVGGAAAHTHTIQLSQEEVDQIKSGLPVTKTTVEAGHTHDVVLEWNTFISEFKFVADSTSGFYATGDHDHGMLTGGHVVNPTIQVVITGAGTGATAYPLLTTSGAIESIVVTDGGIGYTGVVSTILVGGTPTTPAAMTAIASNGAVQSVNISSAGQGYQDTSPEVIAIALQNNNFVPNEFTAKVGDTIRFTNTDLAGHTVENSEGAFLSPNIPQNGVWDYVITKDTELTDLYNLSGSGMASAQMWVRENTVFIDILSSTGGGCRTKGVVDASGNLINASVLNRGTGYVVSDTVRILDVSGPGEGAYGTPIINRSIELTALPISNIGSGYSQDAKVYAIDPTGYADPDDGRKTFGYGATFDVLVIEESHCTDGGTLTSHADSSACASAGFVWHVAGTIEDVTCTFGGQDYIDVEFVVVDSTGTGCVVNSPANKPVHSTITDTVFSSRGNNYGSPFPIVSDTGGIWGATSTIGSNFEGSASLNDGIGSVTIVDDWQDYLVGARLTVVDIDPNPTGYGAEGIVELNANGSVSNIIMTDSGSAYKQPRVTIDGPVLYTGSGINNVNTDIALFGPKGNSVSSPYSDGVSSLTNYKNGIMVQWENENGHSLNDSWSFKLQTWIEGTPDNLVYKTYQVDGALINTSGIIALKDVWDV